MKNVFNNISNKLDEDLKKIILSMLHLYVPIKIDGLKLGSTLVFKLFDIKAHRFYGKYTTFPQDIRTFITLASKILESDYSIPLILVSRICKKLQLEFYACLSLIYSLRSFQYVVMKR